MHTFFSSKSDFFHCCFAWLLVFLVAATIGSIKGRTPHCCHQRPQPRMATVHRWPADSQVIPTLASPWAFVSGSQPRWCKQHPSTQLEDHKISHHASVNPIILRQPVSARRPNRQWELCKTPSCFKSFRCPSAFGFRRQDRRWLNPCEQLGKIHSNHKVHHCSTAI